MMLHKKSKIVDLVYCSLHYQAIKLTEIMHMRTFSRLVFWKIGIKVRHRQRLERQKGRGVIERLGPTLLPGMYTATLVVRVTERAPLLLCPGKIFNQ
jgi:hypothetical protein